MTYTRDHDSKTGAKLNRVANIDIKPFSHQNKAYPRDSHDKPQM